MDQVRVLRIIEYIGDRKWVEETISRSVQGKKSLGEGRSITGVTLTQYPEILEKASHDPEKSSIDRTNQSTPASFSRRGSRP